MKTKVCGGICKQDLPISEFGEHPGTSDGLQNACRACKAEYQARYRDQRIQYRESHSVSTYLQRHQERRVKEEAASLSLEAEQMESESSFPAQPVPVWAGMMNDWLRQRQRSYAWSVK